MCVRVCVLECAGVMVMRYVSLEKEGKRKYINVKVNQMLPFHALNIETICMIFAYLVRKGMEYFFFPV